MSDLFAEEPILKRRLGPILRDLADLGLYLGTSSWKYPGWCGLVYDETRYHYRGKLAKTRFDRDCLAEYAETFPTVCVDAGYYRFPDPSFVARMDSQVPDNFRFSWKVTQDITLVRWPRLPRYGAKGGALNPHFLDADLFRKAFLRSLESSQQKTGCLIFEFSKMSARDVEESGFLKRLPDFFDALPGDWTRGRKTSIFPLATLGCRPRVASPSKRG